MRTAQRYHDFSYGHRVHGHENKCGHIHGHNGRVHFILTGPMDNVGRILDFSAIGKLLCQWLEDNWDHRFLVWSKDPWAAPLKYLDNAGVVAVPFNPTAENMAEYLVESVGPMQLNGTGATLISCKVEETRKCSATYTLTQEKK